MQRKKNITLLISFAALTTLTIAIFLTQRSISSFGIDKTIFHVDDIKSVDSVVLQSSNDTVVLTFSGPRWKVDHTYDADRNMIDVLFATLQQAVPRRPVALKLRDSISTSLKQEGVDVSLYEKGELKKTFFAGGNRKKTQAYFMENDGGQSTPYIMTIPGYHVYVSGILELDENGWRDKYIFGFNWRNFQRLEATFVNPRDNFVVTMKDRKVSVEGLAEADTTRLNDFLDDVSLLTADGFTSTDPDSLQKIQPAMDISITDIGGRKYELAVYPPKQDADSALGLMNRAIPVVFGLEKIRKVVRPRSYFEGK